MITVLLPNARYVPWELAAVNSFPNIFNAIHLGEIDSNTKTSLRTRQETQHAKISNLCFLQNEVKYIRNENKELKSRISNLENNNRDLQDTVADLKAQKAGFVKFSQYTIGVL